MRRENWPELLAEYIAAHEQKPFKWGANDCMTFALGAHEAQTGARACEITWSKAKQADSILKRSGGLAAAISGVLGEPLESILLAHRGDVGLIVVGKREFGAVFDGSFWRAPDAVGLARYDLQAAKHAWRVV